MMVVLRYDTKDQNLHLEYESQIQTTNDDIGADLS